LKTSAAAAFDICFKNLIWKDWTSGFDGTSKIFQVNFLLPLFPNFCKCNMLPHLGCTWSSFVSRGVGLFSSGANAIKKFTPSLGIPYLGV